MQKYIQSEIKTFEFTDFKGPDATAQSAFTPFSFNDLTGQTVSAEKISEQTLKNERLLEKKNNFQIDDIVRQLRGISQQEESELEIKIQEEVNRRLEAAYQEAFQKGLAEGKAAGNSVAFEQYQAELNLKIEGLTQIIDSLKTQHQELIESNRHGIYEFVKRFSKWIILKEIDEKVYLENLFEKLVLELNARKNIIVKVGKSNFEQMPEVIKVVESKLGQLTNVRIEIVPEIKYPGIILESENGLIDGSLEGVFSNIDKIFDQVVSRD